MMKKITCTIFSVFLSSMLYSQSKSLNLSKGNVYVSPKSHLYMKEGLKAEVNTQLIADSDAKYSSSLLFGADQTGSLGDGEVVYKRFLKGTQWNGVGAPATSSTQTIDGLALDPSNNIKKKNDAYAIGIFNPRALDYAWAYHNPGSTYDNNLDQWENLTGREVKLAEGLTVLTTTDTKISFKGDVSVKNGDIIITPFDATSGQISSNGNINGFSSLANPFPSFFKADDLFALQNESKFDVNSIGIYTIDHSTGKYTLEPRTALSTTVLHPGQGFLVKAGDVNNANVGTTPKLTYSRSSQRSQGSSADVFKRSENRYAELKLYLTSDNGKKDYTRVFYSTSCNEELNPGWEGSTFSPDTTFSIHTRYANVEEYAKEDLDVQCVKDNYDNNVIPLSVYAKSGESITFSVGKSSIPSSVNLFIEDRINNTIEKITDESYVVNLNRDLKGKGDFYLHSSPQGTLSLDDLKNNSVDIFKTNLNTLKISGLKTGINSLISVYAVNGQEVLNRTFVSETISNITLPNFSTGIYLIKVSQDNNVYTKKVIIE